MRREFVVPALLIAALIAATGCGQSTKTVWVTGKLLKKGERYVSPDGQAVSITFVALAVLDSSGKTVESRQPYSAEFDPVGGTFTVAGLDRRGIPPGKYRVAVTQKMTREAFDAAHPKLKRNGPNRETDLLNNRFGLESSPIIREITRSTDLTIDLDQPAGS